MTVVGIDPGLTGGFVALSTGFIHLEPMPVVGKDIDLGYLSSTLVTIMNTQEAVHVFLERAQAFPKQGVSSAFNYGVGYGGIKGVCAALGLAMTLVSPAKWHKAIVTGTGDPKACAAETARRLFPNVQLTVGRARKPHAGLVDALLLAEFGRRLLNEPAASSAVASPDPAP